MILIDKNLIQKLEERNLSIEEITYLYDRFTNGSLGYNPSSAVIRKLEYFDYLKNDKVTEKGELIIGEVLSDIPLETKPSSKEDKFDEIWFAFPKDDSTHIHPKTRLIRYNKIKTKEDYLTALKSFSHEQLLEAVKAEVKYRSTLSKDNMLKYMKSSHNWFDSKCYLEWISQEEEEVSNYYGKEIS